MRYVYAQSWLKQMTEKSLRAKSLLVSWIHTKSKNILDKLPKDRFFPGKGIRTIRKSHEKPVYEKGDATWILPTITVKINTTNLFSIRPTPVEAFLEKTEKEFLEFKRKKIVKGEPNFEVRNCVSSTDKRKLFSKGEATK